MSRRLTAMLLALCMVLTMLPTGAFAADGISPVPPQQQTQNSGLVQSSGLSWPEEPYSEGLDWQNNSALDEQLRWVDVGAFVYTRGSFRGSCLVVPGDIHGLPVDTIWNRAFENADHLEQAFLNSTAIENDAFLNCVNLTDVILGDRVTRIGATAFSGCTSIVYHPYGGALYLGTLDNPYHALIRAESTDISEVTIHPDTRVIADKAFAQCTKITEVYIPGGEIGDSAFQGCTALRSVTMGDAVTGIGGSAFAQCNSLTDVHIGDGVTYIGNSAFFDTRISSLHMGANVKEIDDLAFMGSSLRTIVLPEGLERIGANAFDGNSIQTAVIPSSVTEIGKCAFPNKYSMQHVLYLGTMEQWYQIGIGFNEGIDVAKRHYACSEELIAQVLAGSCALCDSCAHRYVLMADTSTCTKNGENSYECDRCGHTYTEESAAHHRWEEANCTQPRRCTGGCGAEEGMSLGGHIWQEATCTAPKTCSRCAETQSGPIPHSWDVLDCTLDKTCAVCGTVQPAGKHFYSNGVCQDCPSMCSTGLRYWPQDAGLAVSVGDCADAHIVIPENHDGKVVYAVQGFGSTAGVDTIISVMLPDTIEIIEDGAFYGNTALKEIHLPDGIRRIGDGAFYGNTALTEIRLPDGLRQIGQQAFYDCTGLQRIEIPYGVKELPEGIFWNCAALQEIIIADSVTAIGDCAFQDCASLKTVTLPDSVTEMGEQAFYRCTALQEVTIGNGLRTIPEYAFTDCSALRKLTMGDSVQTIRFKAFYNCSALEELTVPDSVTQIAMDAFGYCTDLAAVHFGSGLQVIGDSAFYNCTALQTLDLPDSLTEIGNSAFSLCENLTQVTFGSGLQTVGNYAFSNCYLLESLILPVSLTSIGSWAFGIVGTLYYEGTLAQWEAVAKAEDWMGVPNVTVYCLGQCRTYGHAWVEATCTEVKYCPVCGTSEGEALGHDYQDVVTEPTCEENGYTERVCSRCGDTVYVDGSYKPALGHNWVEATCTEGSHCSRCGEAGSFPALGHNERTYTEPPTCTEPGGTVHYCLRCDYTYITDEVPALGHTPGSGPNCYGPQICEVCKIELQPALGHDWADATCDCPKTCSRCGLTEGAALGHDYEETVTAPTCTEAGYTTHTCSRCGDSFVTDEVPALGHSYENGVCVVCGTAQSSEGLSYTEVYDETGNLIAYEVSGIGDCGDTTLIIPATHNGLPVTAIGAEAFAYNQYLRGAVIPDSVTRIGDNAFTDNLYLERVTFGSGVTEIGYGAFSGCISLKEIQLPSSLRVIGERAFYRCNAVTSLTIPSGVTTISTQAFYMCSALTGITIPATVETIGEYAFASCSGLTEVILAGGGEIGQYAFTNCSKLKNVVIGEGVTHISTRAFDYCTQLLCITIPATVMQIDGYAFNGCKNLWHVLYLGTRQQWDAISIAAKNEYLTGATLHCEATGDEITDLEGKLCRICNCPHEYTVETTQPTCTADGLAVYTCSLCGHSYTEILPAPGHSWLDATCEAAKTCSACGETEGEALGHDWADATCDSPKTCSRCGLTEGAALGHDWADATCDSPKTCSRCGLTEGEALGHNYENGVCTVCGDIELLDEGAFGNDLYWTLDSQGVLTIYGSGAMPDFVYGTYGPWYGSNNYNIKKIVISEGITSIGSYAFYNCYNAVRVEIPDTVTRIGASAFYNNASLQELHLSNNVTELGEQAFTKCISLRRISLGTGLSAIESEAFSGCTALTSIGPAGSGADVELPAEITSVTGFANCTGLTSVVLPNTVKTVGNSAFMGCTGLKSIVLPNSVTLIDIYAFYNCTGLTDLTLGTGLKRIGELAFAGCTGLTQVRLPAAVTALDSGAFSSCTALTEVIMSADLLSIGGCAFYKCSKLRQIELPWGVTEIGASAFEYCYALQKVTFNPRLTTIGARAFASCYKLADVELPEALETIGAYAFYGCDAITEITVGDFVTSIGQYAFSYCDSLTYVYIGDRVPCIEAYTFSNSNALFYVELGDSVSGIRDSAFKDCGYMSCMVLGSQLSYISSNAFNNADIGHILYKGTEEQWNAISKDSYCPTTRATRHNNCQGNEYLTDPTVRCLLCEPMITIDMYDLGANGWTGNAIWVYVDKVLTYQVTLEEGKEGSWSIDYDPAKSYRFEFMNAGDHYSNGQCAFDIWLNRDLVFRADYNDCYNYGSYTVVCTICEHSWQDASCEGPKACSRCGLTEGYALGHSYGENYRCIRCDVPAKIKVELEAYGSIGQSYLAIRVNGETLDAEYELSNGYYTSLTWTAYYQYGSFYEFIWDKEANAKCQIVTITIGKDVVFSADQTDCTGYEDDQVIFSICHHTWTDASCAAPKTCVNCGATEGEPLGHSYEAVVTAPTCVQDGYTTYTCAVCGESYIADPVPATGQHTYENGICTGCGAVGLLASGTCGDDLTWALDGNGVLTVSGTGAMWDFYDNVPWADHRSSIRTVIIENGVTTVGERAFSGCSQLTAVTFGSSITTIGWHAFMDCTGLAQLVLPNSVKTIEASAFAGCTGLTKLDLGNGVTSIEYGAFSGCTGLTELTIPESVTSLGSSAFQDCTYLTRINFNAAAMADLSQKSNTFSNAGTKGKGITFTVGAQVSRIPAFLFYPYYEDSAKLIAVEFPEDGACESIGRYAFYECSKLTAVSIPDSVTEIGALAFYGCRGLTSITIPENITAIGSYAFEYCKGLTEIRFNAVSVSDLGDYIFSGVGKSGTDLTVHIGPKVTAIPDGLFRGYESEHIRITQVLFAPDGICGSIGQEAFYGCADLTEIQLPDTVLTIGNSAFSGCTGLVNVKLGNAVTAIGSNAFDGCSGLESINLPDTLTELGGGAFYQCESLRAVTVPGGVGTIGYRTFYGCTALADLVIRDGVTDIDSGAFSGCTALTALSLPDSVRVVRDDAFRDCTGLVTVDLGDGLESLGFCAFANCTGIVSVILPASLTTIGEYAFSGCGAMWHVLYRGSQLQWENITMGENSELLGAVIHYDCTGEEIVDLENRICTLCCQHSYELTAGKEPTCTEPGGASYTCTICGHSYTDGDIPALGHDYVGGCTVETAPAAKTPGKLAGTCVRCGEPVEAEMPALNITDYSFAVLEAPADGAPGTVRYTWKNTIYGQITVDAAFFYGDANGDGKVNGKDVLLLRSYMANYDYDTGASDVAAVAGADANGDGKVNGKDVLLLRAYIANYDYDTGTSTVVLGPKQTP